MRLGILLMVGLLAQAIAGGDARAQQKPTPGAPILFTADELQTDEDSGLVVAKGHVQISQEQRTVLADTVTYNRRTDTFTATGHVSLQEPTGEVLFADYMELNDHFREGFIEDIRVLLSDRSRLAGNTARRTGGDRLELRRGVYSPCDLCREDPTRPPLWQIRAGSIVHDRETHLVEYRDAVIELAGIPILYTPYLSHADPSVKRTSGFLVPTAGNSATLGGHATIPYYWAISPDKDVTFSPTITTDQGFVLASEYRQRFSSGYLDVATSFNNGYSPDPPFNAALRSHISASGLWDLDDQWRTGFSLQRASDQTYERVFHFGGTENFLTSRGFAEAFYRRSFLAINAYTFQTLRLNTSDSDQPFIAPEISYSWAGGVDRFGGRLSADADLLNLNRLRGVGNHRLSLGTAWTRPFDGLVGDRFTATILARADGYAATDLRLTPQDMPQNPLTARVFPQAALQWQYPWVRRGTASSQLIEPVVAFIAGPNGENPPQIPNEDSLAFDFNDTQLFQPNRFAGLDRVDSGDRVDYGLRAAYYADGGGNASMLIGQSRRLQKNSSFPPGSGLEDKLSDIVGRFIISPSEYLDAVYRYRLSKQNLRVERQEVGVSGGPSKLRISTSYLRLPPDLVGNDTGNRDQLSVSATLGLARYWTLTLATTKNLTGPLGTVSSAAIATYQDECLAFVTSLSQSGTQDRDVKPGASLLFSLVFKNLGEITAPAFATTGVR